MKKRKLLSRHYAYARFTYDSLFLSFLPSFLMIPPQLVVDFYVEQGRRVYGDIVAPSETPSFSNPRSQLLALITI